MRDDSYDYDQRPDRERGQDRRSSGSAPDDAADVVLADLDRGPPDDRAKERLRVAVRVYKGHPFVDVRLVFRGRDGDYRGTQKGVTVKRRELDAVIEALTQARAQMGAREG